MINYYISEDNCVKTIDAAQNGCWISLINPSEEELKPISKRYDIHMDSLKAALDTDERSRIEIDNTYTMILVNIPAIEDSNDKELYNTIPLSIFVTKDTVITICDENTPVIHSFLDGIVPDFFTNMKSRFILQVLYQTASLYLEYLRIIYKKSDVVEHKMHRSTQNRELFELLKLEKSLVYFTTALRSNEAVLEKLFRSDLIKKYPDDLSLLEDVIVENKQAIEMANIYSGIISGMVDAFASVISNNLNIVMKVLAIITIVLSIPTMIFSAYGMNLNLGGMPFSETPNGFAIVVGLSVVISVIVTLIFVKLRMFK